jgi:nucleotide-binding universal stress UspA family protein
LIAGEESRQHPIALHKEDLMLPIRTILYPTDFSHYSNAAFQLTCSLARDYGATVVVLHVSPPPVAHGEVVARRQPNGYRDELWQLLRRYQAPGLTATVRHRLEEGDPATEILRVARELNGDLIVLGTHGRTGLGRLLMGSVAEQVVRQAPCPVLTVKTPGPEPAQAPAPQPEEAGRLPGA